MSTCKSCIVTGMLSAMAGSAMTAIVLTTVCSSRHRMKNSVNHALKNLTKSIEDMMS